MPKEEEENEPDWILVDETQRNWSAARRVAYSKIHDLPNAYFYSYTAPGEMQKHGPWTRVETQEFMAQIQNVGGWYLVWMDGWMCVCMCERHV